MSGSEFINWATNLVTVLVTSGVFGIVLQKRFNRKAERDEAERLEREKERDADREKEDAERRHRDQEDLLAQSRAVAQRSALESANAAYQQVSDRCDRCLDELGGLRDITGRMIDAVEVLLTGDNSEKARADARAIVRLARRAM